MIKIEDEYVGFISLTDILVKIAIAQDSEIAPAANTLRLTLQKDFRWQHVNFACFCSHDGLMDTSVRETQLISEMLEVLDKEQEAESMAATKLEKICNSTAFLSQKPDLKFDSLLQPSTEDFLEYHHACFDIYGFFSKDMEPLLKWELEILALRTKKHEIRNNEKISTTEKKELLLQASDEINAIIKQFTPSENKPTTRESTYLNIIGALTEVINGRHGGAKHPDFKNQSELIAMIETQYRGYSGLSKRTLEEKFAKAKRSLENS